MPARTERHAPAPTVSVVLATYNGATYLEEQLRSLRFQTRLPDEVVIADDASTDSTRSIVESFARVAPFPVTIITQASHVGTCETFTAGFVGSTGDLIFICDQDDVWHPEKVAVMTERMMRRPEALLAFSDAELVDAEGRRISRSRWRIAGFGPRQWQAMDRDPLGQMLMRQIVSGCTAAIRRELLPALLPFPSGLHPALPTMMYDRWISLLSAAAGAIETVPERLVRYRIHPGQQIGIPALRLRRVAPQTALRAGQFVAPRTEKAGRFAYLHAHLEEIAKRLAVSDIDSASTELWVQMADEHIRTRGSIQGRRHRRIATILSAYLDPDGYRRFSMGAAAAMSDAIR